MSTNVPSDGYKTYTSSIYNLPHELLVEIISFLSSDKSTLSACSRVSRALLEPCRTQLFHTLELRDGVKSQNGCRVFTFTTFSAFLSASPCIATSIRCLTLVVSNPISLTTLASILQSTSGLQKLAVQSIRWTASQESRATVRRTLALPHLRNLTLGFRMLHYSDCTISFDLIACAPHLRVLEFIGGDLCGGGEESSSPDVLPAGLEIQEFTALGWSDAQFFEEIERFPSLHRLRKLTVGVRLNQQNVSPILDFLSSYGEKLESLDLHVVMREDSACPLPGPKPHSSCPKLLSLRLFIQCHAIPEDIMNPLAILLSHLSLSALQELTWVLPGVLSKNKHLCRRVLDWKQLEAPLCRCGSLRTFKVLKAAQTQTEQVPADTHMKEWVVESLPKLAEEGKLCFA